MTSKGSSTLSKKKEDAKSKGSTSAKSKTKDIESGSLLNEKTAEDQSKRPEPPSPGTPANIPIGGLPSTPPTIRMPSAAMIRQVAAVQRQMPFFPAPTPGTGKPMMVVYMPMKGKSKKKKKSTSGKKKKTKGGETEDEESDRASTPEIPMTPSAVGLPAVTTEAVVPHAIVVYGPASTPIIIPLSNKDEKGQVPPGSPPEALAPLTPTPGIFSVTGTGIPVFTPTSALPVDKEKTLFPPGAVRGHLTFILNACAAFVSETGPQAVYHRPDPQKPSLKDKIGDTVPVTGHVLLPKAGMPSFTRISTAASPPYNPPGACLGVLARNKTNGCTFFVPADGRSVGPQLVLGGHPAPPITKKAVGGSIQGVVVKESTGLMKCQPSTVLTGDMAGFVVSAPNGAPVFVQEARQYVSDTGSFVGLPQDETSNANYKDAKSTQDAQSMGVKQPSKAAAVSPSKAAAPPPKYQAVSRIMKNGKMVVVAVNGKPLSEAEQIAFAAGSTVAPPREEATGKVPALPASGADVPPPSAFLPAPPVGRVPTAVMIPGAEASKSKMLEAVAAATAVEAELERAEKEAKAEEEKRAKEIATMRANQANEYAKFLSDRSQAFGGYGKY